MTVKKRLLDLDPDGVRLSHTILAMSSIGHIEPPWNTYCDNECSETQLQHRYGVRITSSCPHTWLPVTERGVASNNLEPIRCSGYRAASRQNRYVQVEDCMPCVWDVLWLDDQSPDGQDPCGPCDERTLEDFEVL